MTKYGYARVSTRRQSTSTQVKALMRQGVGKHHITEEVVSGAKADRPKLTELLEELRAGDELHVTKLDRLGRNTQELLAIAEGLEAGGVALVVDGSTYDPTTPLGKMFFGLLAVFAEFERDLIRARTMERLDYQRAKGIHVGRPRATTDEQDAAIFKLHKSGFSYREIREATGLSNGVLSRIINDYKAKEALAGDPPLRREVKAVMEDRDRELAKLSKLFPKKEAA